MKRNFILKFAISLAIALLTISFSATVFAAEGTWTKSGNTLTSPDGTVYTAYDVPAGYRINRWHYSTLQSSSTSSVPDVTSYGKGAKVVFVNYDYEKYFTTDDDKQALDDYFNGNGGEYFLSARDFRSGAKFDGIAAVMARYYSDEKTEITVTKLSDKLSARVINVDHTYTFSAFLGEIYLIDGEYYYVDFAALPNNAFDAEGNLSYRSGQVDMLKLTEAETETYLAAHERFDDFYYSLFGDDDYARYYDDGSYYVNHAFNARAFWSLIFNVSLPLMIAVWSLILILKKKRDDYKRLYFVFVPACLWLVAGIIIFVLII